MSHKRGILIISLVLVSVFITFISASGTHPADQVVVGIDGVSTNLNSITSSTLGQTHVYTAGTAPDPGHDASQIWVSVKDGEMTLLSALQSPDRLCPNPSSPLTYTSVNIPNPSHLATEINLASGESLQQAINSKTYCCVPDCTGKNCGSDGCGGTCGTCTGSGMSCNAGGNCCSFNMGNPCQVNACTNGKTACDGSCTETSYVSVGTSCGTDATCDGSGNCVSSCYTCSELVDTCGTSSDGCGGTLNCGTCGSGKTCAGGNSYDFPPPEGDLNEGYSCCASNLGQSCGSDICGGKTIGCDGTCSGSASSDLSRGTTCGTDETCDGSGNCQGWSGSDCSNCPFGTSSVTNNGVTYEYCKNDGTYWGISNGYSSKGPVGCAVYSYYCIWQTTDPSSWGTYECPGGNSWQMYPAGSF